MSCVCVPLCGGRLALLPVRMEPSASNGAISSRSTTSCHTRLCTNVLLLNPYARQSAVAASCDMKALYICSNMSWFATTHRFGSWRAHNQYIVVVSHSVSGGFFSFVCAWLTIIDDTNYAVKKFGEQYWKCVFILCVGLLATLADTDNHDSLCFAFFSCFVCSWY